MLGVVPHWDLCEQAYKDERIVGTGVRMYISVMYVYLHAYSYMFLIVKCLFSAIWIISYLCPADCQPTRSQRAISCDEICVEWFRARAFAMRLTRDETVVRRELRWLRVSLCFCVCVYCSLLTSDARFWG